MMAAVFLNTYLKRGQSILTICSPHQGLDYSGAAKLYGCDYTKISSPDELSSVLANVSQETGVHIIEIPTNREYSRELHKKYTKVSVDMEALL